MSANRRLENIFDRVAKLHADTEDGTLTTQGAAALDVKEFAFFRLAYRWWFGEDANDEVLEQPFMRFLKTRRAPHWVRQFAREILDRQRSGQLDRTAYGLPVATRMSPTLARIDAYLRGAYVAAWIVAVAALLIGISI